MNTLNLNRKLIGASLAAGSFMGAGVMDAEPQTVEASNYEQINQGFYEIPGSCPDYAGRTISIQTERMLRNIGYTGIEVNGEIDDEKEQEAFRGVQIHMKQIDVLDDSVSDCGYPGILTRRAAEKMLEPSELADESQISDTSSSRNRTASNGPNVGLAASTERYYEEDCSRQELYTMDTIKSIQKALNVFVDGDFGDETCNAMIRHKITSGISKPDRSDFGFLGPKTAGSLGVILDEKTSNQTTSRTNRDTRNASEVIEGCESKYSSKYVVCADTGPGAETGYLYEKSDGEQKLLSQFEITSSQVDVDGPYKNGDTLTRKGHHIMGYAARKTPKLGLKNFLQFNGGQGIHYYPVVGASADSSGCIRVNYDTSVLLYDTLADHVGNVEIIVK